MNYFNVALAIYGFFAALVIADITRNHFLGVKYDWMKLSTWALFAFGITASPMFYLTELLMLCTLRSEVRTLYLKARGLKKLDQCKLTVTLDDDSIAGFTIEGIDPCKGKSFETFIMLTAVTTYTIRQKNEQLSIFNKPTLLLMSMVKPGTH